MPGILPRSDGVLKASVAPKMATAAQPMPHTIGDVHAIPETDDRNGVTLENGTHEHVNGHSANGVSTTSMHLQRQSSDAVENFVGQLPPEIEHITFGYVHFSTLISRLVQETFNGLADVINEMSDMQIPPPGQHAPLIHLNHQVNGNGNTLGANVQKKLRMLNFASDRRAQFIKAMILLRWARQAEALGKIIDLNVWTKFRTSDSDGCVRWMGELKRRLGYLRDPNPDIKTALEVLSLGKASWLPDLGYLPPESLSSHQLLTTLRKINTLLSIRLNLHEDIPPALRQFSIASGRATFYVQHEFEVDLSIAEEDPSSQLYFIDFRFTFSPAPTELLVGRLRDAIESRANDVLKSEGLQGLFEFLHNLTLTHKISVLRDQAFEMARGYWSEQLKIEPVRRSLVVQYWTSKPGGKNWIEIGLRRGQLSTSSYALDTQRVPYIALRWFRGGKEVLDHPVSMNMGELLLADTLKQVIALHTTYSFEQIALKLGESPLYSGNYLRAKCHPSAKEPSDAALLVQLTTSTAIKVVQEPLSGRISVLPASQSNSRAEHEMNRLASPATEGASRLAYLRSSVAETDAEKGARSLEWELVRSINPNQETLQRVFAKYVQRIRFFRRASWSPDWILAFTASLEGDFWWIVELANKAVTGGGSAIGQMLKAAYRIELPGPKSLVLDPSFANLAIVERRAAGMISQLVDTRALQPFIPHRVELPKRDSAGGRSETLSIHFLHKTALSAMKASNTISFSWLEEAVRLIYCGLGRSRSLAMHVAIVRMRQSVSELQSLVASIPSVVFMPGADTIPDALKIQILTKVGISQIPNLQGRLKALALLLDYAFAIRSCGLTCKATSLTCLEFYYSDKETHLKATIHFPDGEPKQVSLNKPNPHLRIVDHLSEKLRFRSLGPVISMLRITLPLLRTFSAIEARRTNGGLEILTRSDQWYQVRYSDPYARASFDICLRYKRDDPKWFISDASIRKPEMADEAFERDLKLVTRGKGEGWRGMPGGMIADIEGVQDLVLKLDEVFRTRKHVAGESNARKRKAEDDVVEID